MAGPWISVDDLKQSLADALKKDVAQLAAYWTRITTSARDAGYSDLTAILLGKGYTMGQLDGWDDRVRFNRDQSLFWCLVNGAGLGDYSDRDYNKLDHRKELIASATIMIAGTPTAPGGTGDAGGVAVGSLTQQSDGVDYGTTFGLRVNRANSTNEFGDPIRYW